MESEEEDLRLKKNVFIGYVDIAAAGCRALLGIDLRSEFYPLRVPGLEACRPVCVLSRDPAITEHALMPFQVLHCKYEEFSLIVLNTIIPLSRVHVVAARIIDLIRRSPVERVTVLSTLVMDLSDPNIKPMYECCFNGKKKVTRFPPLRPEVKIFDRFLNVLLQFLRVEGLPTSVYFCPAMRALEGVATDIDGTYQVIEQLQKNIEAETRLIFNLEKSADICYLGDMDTESSGADLMYM